MFLLYFASCTESILELDTGNHPDFEVPCTNLAVQSPSNKGVLHIMINHVETLFPELGSCCDSWDGLWSADFAFDVPGKIYLSPILYDVSGGVIYSAFDVPSGTINDWNLRSCELTLWSVTP